ncbi:CU044_5270 family protein [Actinoallomurus acaciae]|uniref:CU044_5270 family protein n=1 Tax=Actinoallomurus acaciae TaxID=502577 RepID=A0ABV5YDD2_9ACTN
MSSGVHMNENSDGVFRALRPEALDGLAAETYARRREQDISRALAVTSSTTMSGAVPRTVRRRMPRLLAAGLTAGAVAAAAAGVIVATNSSGGRHTHAPATAQRLDARTVLLVSAESAAKAPATTGAFWYTRERETRLIGPINERTARNKAGAKKSGKMKPPPVTAYISSTQDTWNGRDRRDRTITGIDRKITFPNPAEKARWKALGAPELEPWSAKQHVSDYDFSHSKLTKVQQDKAVDALTKLPNDPDALERVLQGWFKDENQASAAHDGVPMSGDFALYAFGTAQDLLAGPITPATKSALFRVLAKQPGITYLGTGTDRLGRKGAVLAMSGGTTAEKTTSSGSEIRLIIDSKTGQLLEQESGDRKSPSLVMTYQTMGWVDHLGDRP